MNNQFIAFGVIDSLGNKDQVLAFENYSYIVILSKGCVKDKIPRQSIKKAVQNIISPTSFTIYFKYDHPPIHLQTLRAKQSKEICYYLNDFIQSKPITLDESYFMMYCTFNSVQNRKRMGEVEKKGKHTWAKRTLQLYFRHLLVFRHPPKNTEIRDDQDYPLNILDLQNILVDRVDDKVLKLITHREYEFRFPDVDSADSWYREISSLVQNLQESAIETPPPCESVEEEQRIESEPEKEMVRQPLVSVAYLQSKLQEMEEKRKLRLSKESEPIPPPIPPPPPKHGSRKNI